MTTRTLRIGDGHGGELTLRLELPVVAPPRGCAVLAHGAAQVEAAALADALADRGWSVLQLETERAADVVAAARWLSAEHQAPRVLVGQATAGPAVLAAAVELPEVVAVASVGAPAIADDGFVGARLTIEGTRRDPDDARHVAAAVAAWAESFAPRPELPTPHQERVSVWGSEQGFRTLITSGAHTLHADEPADLGGTDTAPNPYEYLLGALGACTVMTLRMYADRKGWPLEQVVAHLHHERIHAKDCSDCGEGLSGKVARIERVVEVHGADLTDEHRERLLQIANKCPVHRTLTEGPLVIVTRAKPSG